MPFARVAQHQVLQSNLATRGNGSEGPVHQLTLDTNFAAASPSQCVLSHVRIGWAYIDHFNFATGVMSTSLYKARTGATNRMRGTGAITGGYGLLVRSILFCPLRWHETLC
jgi:hypothetical protein